MSINSIVPGAPESLSATISGIISILLSWEGVNCSKRHGVITGYRVHREDNNSSQYTDPLTYNVTITGLCPFLTYSFDLSAVNKAGVGCPITVKG